MTWLGVGLYGLVLFGPLYFLDLQVYFLQQARKMLTHYFFKWVFSTLISLLSGAPVM